jgi:exonuclease III
VEWLDFMLLNTYVPANKTKAELEATNEWRDKNRGRWDHETKMFAREVFKPLVWMGDFNVGLDDSDKRHSNHSTSQRGQPDQPSPCWQPELGAEKIQRVAGGG